MKEKKNYRIIIGGGGTGGHVFPAISIANALKGMLDDPLFLFVGATGKLEMNKVPEAGYEIVGLPVAGFQRKLSFKNFSFFFKLFRSVLLSRRIIRSFKPDIAIGVGGYASGPIIRAAARRRVPVLIQEQNSYAGVTNRLLAKSAVCICVAYEGMEKYFPGDRIILTGNPVRQDLILPASEKLNSFNSFGLDPKRKVLLIIGGSLGSGTLNSSVEKHLDMIAGLELQLVWQCGSFYYEKSRILLDMSPAKNIVLLPFIKEMNRAFQVADLIVSRAGAGTISELCLVGKPVILVPSPNVAEDHQTSNARALSSRDAAITISDRDARNDLIPTALKVINNEERKKVLSENIGKFAIPDSAERIANEIIKILS